MRPPVWRMAVGCVRRCLFSRRRTTGPQPCDMPMARLLLAREATYDLTIAAALGDIDRVTAILDAEPSRVSDARPNLRRPLTAAVEFGHEGRRFRGSCSPAAPTRRGRTQTNPPEGRGAAQRRPSGQPSDGRTTAGARGRPECVRRLCRQRHARGEDTGVRALLAAHWRNAGSLRPRLARRKTMKS